MDTRKFLEGIGVTALVALLAVIALLSCSEVAAQGSIIYVDENAAGAATGLSWTDAYTNVQDALAETNADGSTDYEIWVAEGVYYPDEGAGTIADSESMSFTLRYNNVQLYGGFVGTETLRTQRDWETNVTILSGDIDANDWNTDTNAIAETWNDIQGNNAYHVLYLDGITNESVTSSTVIDGFTITAGQADGNEIHDSGGGGVCYGSGSACSPNLTNLTFSGNSADNSGGGMYNGGDPTLTNTTFQGNRAIGDDGGGFYNTSTPTLNNVIFRGNQASSAGGGMYNDGGSPALNNVIFSENQASYGGGMGNWNLAHPTLTNVTFSGNKANSEGGGLCNYWSSDPILKNCLLWDNIAATSGDQIKNAHGGTSAIAYSLVQNSGGSGSGWDTSIGTDSGNNLDANPQFVAPITATAAPTSTGDYRLQASSSAVDSGDNDVVISGTDLDGTPRIIGGTVDMGAYEAQPALALHKSVTPAQNVAHHGTITYTVVLSNTDAGNDSGVRFTDTLPSEVDFATWVISPTGTLRVGDTITWIGAVTAGHAITWTWTATHTGNYADAVYNTATCSGTVQAQQAQASFRVEELAASPHPALCRCGCCSWWERPYLGHRVSIPAGRPRRDQRQRCNELRNLGRRGRLLPRRGRGPHG